MKTLKIVSFLMLFSGQIKADVIYSPFIDHGLFFSLEGIASYEISFSKSNTVNFWGGVGLVSSVSEINHPAFGGEISMELRQYFVKDKFSGFNLGLYAGLAYMRNPNLYHDELTFSENSFGFVPGLKLAYKLKMNSWLVGEPYIGVSVPFYADRSNDVSFWESYSGLIVTIGIRIGFNKVN
jgi:hypothetical protein